MTVYFETVCCLGKRIRVSRKHWELIVQRKHLEIARREKDVQATLREAESVRLSQTDESVFLYYRRSGKYYLCVVCRHLDGEGFIVTSYLTDRLKEGHEVWRR